MSFSNSAYKCKAIHSYRQALMFFTRHTKPRGKKWQDNERPIYITGGKPSPRMYHYRMDAGPIDPATSTPAYFDLVLHGTSVIRYMAPTEDNKTVVYLTYGGWPSTMTRSFMHQHGWYYAQSHETTTGTKVAVPLNYAAKSAKWIDGKWLAKLTFDADNKLIVDESDHMPVYKRQSSTDDKAVRATLRRKLDILHDLLWFSIENEHNDLQESVHGNFTSKWKIANEFGPFTSALRGVHVDYGIALRENKEEFLQDGVDFTPATIEAMQALYRAAYRYAYGKRIHNDYANFSCGGKIEPPTQDDMRKTLLSYIMGMLGIKNGSEYEPLPKFILASEFPSSRAHFLRG